MFESFVNNIMVMTNIIIFLEIDGAEYIVISGM